MDSEAATEWLLINAMDPSIDEPLPETPPRPKQKKRSGKWRRQEFVPSQSVSSMYRDDVMTVCCDDVMFIVMMS